MKNMLLAALLAASALAASAQDKHNVRLAEPADGATVASPFTVRFEVSGMKVAPAGTAEPNTGHHHLLIDHEPIKKGEEVPFDKTHLHFGAGQSEAKVTLPPGKYKLTAQFADGDHHSYGEAYSQTISITVK
jgi:hypothetical protein